MTQIKCHGICYSAKKNHPFPLVDEVSRKGSEKFEWKKNDENMSFMNI